MGRWRCTGQGDSRPAPSVRPIPLLLGPLTFGEGPFGEGPFGETVSLGRGGGTGLAVGAAGEETAGDETVGDETVGVEVAGEGRGGESRGGAEEEGGVGGGSAACGWMRRGAWIGAGDAWLDD